MTILKQILVSQEVEVLISHKIYFVIVYACG